MDIIIKMLFIISMFIFNFNAIIALLNVKRDEAATAGFIVLVGFNVLAVTALLIILHPLMTNAPALLITSGLIGAAAILALSSIPFIKK